VILMSIVAITPETEIRRDLSLQLRKNSLYARAYKRQESVLETLEPWTLDNSRIGEQRGCSFRFDGFSNSTSR